MKYWNEMDTKYGFNDGYAIPPDAEACREVYVKVLNGLLRKNESKCRIIPVNVPTRYNTLIWMRVGIPAYNRHLSGITEITDEVPADEAWNNSVEEAMEIDLDSYVRCEPTVDWSGLENDLHEILNENNPI